MKKNTPPWIFGFQNIIIQRNQFRDIACVILNLFNDIPCRSKTLEAETGLGIPNSFYSYIGRANLLYGNGLFFLNIETDGWEESDKGICPFDSGGLWFDYIYTEPVLSSETDKRLFFNKYDNPLNNWDLVFNNYMKSNYSDYKKYIEGFPPDISNGCVEIIKTKNNQENAWTWEGRIDKKRIDEDRLEVTKFYCSLDKLELLNLEVNRMPNLNLDQKVKIKKYLKTKSVPCNFPESPIYRATKDLLKDE